MVCFLFLSSLMVLGQVVQLAVDVDAHEALLLERLELLFVLALAVAHHRRQHGEARAFGQLEHAVDHLLHRLRGDALAAVVAVDDADARVEQAQVVVDLGDRADGRARILRGRLLLDRDGRRQALDGVDVGLAHLLEELARVGAQGLDVAALALGVDGVERERGLAGAGKPSDDDELVARKLDVDVLEVVLASAFDDDLVHARPLRAVHAQRGGTAYHGRNATFESQIVAGPTFVIPRSEVELRAHRRTCRARAPRRRRSRQWPQLPTSTPASAPSSKWSVRTNSRGAAIVDPGVLGDSQRCRRAGARRSGAWRCWSADRTWRRRRPHSRRR